MHGLVSTAARSLGIFLEEGLPLYAVWIPHERHRAPFYISGQHRGHTHVVLDYMRFAQCIARIDQALQITHLQHAATNADGVFLIQVKPSVRCELSTPT